MDDGVIWDEDRSANIDDKIIIDDTAANFCECFWVAW